MSLESRISKLERNHRGPIETIFLIDEFPGDEPAARVLDGPGLRIVLIPETDDYESLSTPRFRPLA